MVESPTLKGLAMMHSALVFWKLTFLREKLFVLYFTMQNLVIFY